ncbi:MAG: hypothetical protein J3T61_05920 [Candidatus Brocadiales bacterium]|nr:hypothetical protein [Candidatus Bathyanammoxibius sp.]
MSTTRTVLMALAVIACIVYPYVPVYADWQSTVKQGDELYAKRSDKDGRKELEAAIKQYEAAVKEIPEKDEKARAGVYVKLSRAYYKIAQYFSQSDDDRSNMSDKGQKWAEKAIDIEPKNAEAHYYMGTNLGLWRSIHKASFRGGLTGGGIKKEFQKAADLDPKGLYGQPDMRTAEYLLARGDSQKALSYAKKAVEIQPKLLMNKLILAQAMWVTNDQMGSRKVLAEIAAQSDDIIPSEILENRDTIKEAKQIQGNIANNNEPDW